MAKIASALIGISIGTAGSLAFLHPDKAIAIATRAAPVMSQMAPVPGARPYSLCHYGKHTDCVVDGDTFYYGSDKIRIADIDAPETHPPRCAKEKELGNRATERLSQLLADGRFELRRLGSRDRDKYGRKLRIVMVDGQSAGEMLVNEGLARKWTGKRRPWCG